MSHKTELELLSIACDNESNAHILSLTTEKIMKTKVGIVDELPISQEEKIALIQKLNGYRYVDEIHELKNGAFLRWIDMRDIDNIVLVSGAFFCEIIFTDDNSCMRMRNIRGRYFELKMDDVILFQKLSPQEKVLLSALSYMADAK